MVVAVGGGVRFSGGELCRTAEVLRQANADHPGQWQGKAEEAPPPHGRLQWTSQPAGGTLPVCSLDLAFGPSNLLALGSGGTDGRRCLVSGLRRIVRVAKGGRVPLQPQTATRTRITVRTITLQLAWTPLKGLISCKRIEVSVIREDTVSGLLPGATHPPEAPAWPPCTQPHTNQSQLGLCVVFLGNWNADSSSRSTGPLSSVSRRLQKLAAEEAVQVRELLLGLAY
ncbi:uncharacterized protein LOC120222971 [Hyaena hyaena]|uniref:uncharacterized protein LOC120222971 n=1 Tax=Hyaena hyaena TaxID=95912 RepID=UPI0019206E7A|nr:uncharacterized protein LOC120222971 [Hyaena hyaena]